MENATESTRRPFGGRADIIVIVALLLVATVWVAASLLFREAGAYVVVEEDGVEVGRYSLDADGEYSLGGGSNLLVIEDGAAYMKSADCPDKTCVRVGRISYRGETIVCLPNRITVTVVGADGVDLVS